MPAPKGCCPPQLFPRHLSGSRGTPSPEFFLPNLCPSPTLAALGFGLWRAGESRQPSKAAEPWCPPRGPTYGRVGGWEGTLPAAGRVGLGVSMMPAPVDLPS